MATSTAKAATSGESDEVFGTAYQIDTEEDLATVMKKINESDNGK